jgi:hypothetical protein
LDGELDGALDGELDALDGELDALDGELDALSGALDGTLDGKPAFNAGRSSVAAFARARLRGACETVGGGRLEAEGESPLVVDAGHLTVSVIAEAEGPVEATVEATLEATVEGASDVTPDGTFDLEATA